MRREPGLLTSGMGLLRLALATVVTISVSGATMSGRTLAGFTAETINPGNIFEATTLELQSFFGAQPGMSAGGRGVFVVGPGAMPAPGQTPVAGAATGGLAPGTILQNTLTLRNAGTGPADRLNFYVTAATVQNRPSDACNASNDPARLTATGRSAFTPSQAAAAVSAGCGLGRLANVLDLMIYYPVPGDATGRQFVCVYPEPPPGRTVVTVTSRSDLVDPALGGCGFGPLIDPARPVPPAAGDETAPVSAAGHLLASLLTPGIPVPGFNAAPAALRPGQCLQAVATADGSCPRHLWMPGEERMVTVAVRLRDGPAVNNDFQGARATFDFKWQAEAGPPG